MKAMILKRKSKPTRSFTAIILKSSLLTRLYGSRDNRSYLERNHIRFAGKPLGRPPKSTPENKDEMKRLKTQRRQEYRERIPIEGKFGQRKYGYRLNNIRAKRADTSAAWINSIFLVMNLLILVRVFICLRNLAAKIAFG
jgi:hypothetical protein